MGSVHFVQVASIPIGALPHGLWPSGDGSRIYVGLENADAVAAIDAASNTVLAAIPIGQGPQGVAYVSGAVPVGDGRANLVPLARAGMKIKLTLAGTGRSQVTLFDQGQIYILQAAVAGLSPKMPYVLGLSSRADGSGVILEIENFDGKTGKMLIGYR